MPYTTLSPSMRGGGADDFYSSDDLLGFENAKILFAIGGGCLLVVLVFGIFLCRADISAGRRRRALSMHQVES